ncbi:hypothetical protein PCC9214_01186 [Planktothrix tepida]|uniref:Uncharacterized protein n=2 Tax=Planktothrix TaxID=54304 RepID=A0A1J1LG42_9CYAN|nr:MULTISPECIES: hypothetical protein [Planktothrix]CAD5929488.1 hypothetical protein PCC9214_01186 [Planktothrix tepida]CAD5979943.1 hypothetical protein NO713_04596 [Planktothrix pseudagardhii]CUR31483.1 hypothetical protein PL9214291074 [Planktothrix tepida PCC 9214]
MTSPPKFDWITFIARFGCGFIIGGFLSALRFPQSFLMAFVIGGLLCGVLAWLLGDRFWTSRWWW